MDKDYTHITLVLDRSGSMASCWGDTMGGLETLLKENKKDKNRCTFSFYNFDNNIEQTHDFVDIQLVSENVSDFGISPRGGTALYDAIGRAINETGKKLAGIPDPVRAGRVVFVIQTDGYENASKEFTADTIKKMISEQSEKYDWTFMFIGADQSSVLEATAKLGMQVNNTAFYNTKNTSDTFNILASKLSTARSASFEAYSSTLDFNEEEKVKMSK